MIGLYSNRTFHDLVGDNLVAKHLRENTLNIDVREMIGNMRTLMRCRDDGPQLWGGLKRVHGQNVHPCNVH
jgi:hypothetical protein